MKLSTEKQLKIFQRLSRNEEYLIKINKLRKLYGIPSMGYNKDALSSTELQVIRGVLLTDRSLDIISSNLREFNLSKNQIRALADYLLFNYFSFNEVNFLFRKQNFPIKHSVKGVTFNPNYLPEPPHLYLKIFPNTTYSDVVENWDEIREYKRYLRSKNSGIFRVFLENEELFIEIGPFTTQKQLKSSWEEVKRLQSRMRGFSEEQHRSYFNHKLDSRIIEFHNLGYTANQIIQELNLPAHIYDKNYINKKIRRFKGKKN